MIIYNGYFERLEEKVCSESVNVSYRLNSQIKFFHITFPTDTAVLSKMQ